MARTEPTSKLFRVAEYRTARATLRRSATWSLSFGVLSVVAGCAWMPLDWALTVLGAALIGTGAWNILAPRPTSIVLDSITLLLVGAYNLIGAVLAVMDGLPPSPVRAFLGALQLVWGIQRLGNLGQFANAFLERPADADGRDVEQALGAIRGATVSAEIVEITAGTVWKRPWRARLAGEHAVFVEVRGQGLLMGTRHTVAIVPRGTPAPGAAIQADMTVGQTRTRVVLSAGAFHAYEQWKAGAPLARPAAA